MSMICCLREADENLIDELLSGPESILDFLDEEQGEVNLDKAWHGIHFLLTGSAEGGEEPLAYLLKGGELVGEVDVGYGPARALRPDEVRRFASALSAINAQEMSRRYNPEAMKQAGVYPDIWQQKDEEPLTYVLEYYGVLQNTVNQASSRNKGLIIYYT